MLPKASVECLRRRIHSTAKPQFGPISAGQSGRGCCCQRFPNLSILPPMKPFLAALALCAFFLAPSLRATDDTVEERYGKAYALIIAGDAAAQKGQADLA